MLNFYFFCKKKLSETLIYMKAFLLCFYKGKGYMFKICGCGRLVGKSEECSYCKSKHNKYYDKYVRDKESKKFYNSSEWKRVRRLALIRDKYLCVKCIAKGRLVPANLVHHIREVRDNPELKLDLNNLITVCQECHTKLHKTKPPHLKKI